MPFLTRARLASLPFLLAASPALAGDGLCLTGDFDAFLARFSHEIAVQENATADPLILDVSDPMAEGDDPQLRGYETPLAEVTWPVMPDIAVLDSLGLEMFVEDLNAVGKSVLLRGTGTGERMTWFFTQDPCWTLVRVLDESM